MKYKLDLGSPKNKEAKHIIFITAKATGTNVQMLVSRCRVRNLVDARRICYVMLRDKLKMTYGEIGSHFDRDHASVMHNYEQHEDLLRMYADYRIMYERVKGRLMNNPYVETDMYEIIDNLAFRLDELEKQIKKISL
jgi:chromosomal replication initiation ATPase DnaA